MSDDEKVELPDNMFVQEQLARLELLKKEPARLQELLEIDRTRVGQEAERLELLRRDLGQIGEHRTKLERAWLEQNAALRDIASAIREVASKR